MCRSFDNGRARHVIPKVASGAEVPHTEISMLGNAPPATRGKLMGSLGMDGRCWLRESGLDQGSLPAAGFGSGKGPPRSAVGCCCTCDHLIAQQCESMVVYRIYAIVTALEFIEFSRYLLPQQAMLETPSAAVIVASSAAVGRQPPPSPPLLRLHRYGPSPPGWLFGQL